MKYSDITKLKYLAQDKNSRSANPAVVRNSTVFFKTMQELINHENLVKKGSKVNFYEYGSCLLYTSPSPRDVEESRMPSSA